MLKRITFLCFIPVFSLILSAQIPSGYYDTLDAKKEAELKTSCHNIIREHTYLDYDEGTYIWWYDYFMETDRHPDGYFWDMYSNNKYTDYNGSRQNREHSMPRSWWGTSSNYASYDANGDLHNLYPSDYDANTEKSNYPLGVVGSATFDNGVVKVGSSSFSGYSGVVFEPADEYKGDFARTYMYMVTCYEDYASNWRGTGTNSMLLNNTYPTLKPYAINLLMEWHRADPVSQKELNRNNKVFQIQNNRNPFVDYPLLAEYIWGNKTGQYFYLDEGGDPEISVDILNATFASTLSPFTTYDLDGFQNWYIDASYKYAKISGYYGGINNVNEDWLISPAMDLSGYNNVKLNFQHAGKLFGANFADLTLWVSTNYESGNPYDAEWTELDIPNYMSGEDWIFVSSGEIDLAAYIGDENVRIAFKYISTVDAAATWQVRDLKVVGTKTTTGNNTNTIEPELKNIVAENGKISFDADGNQIVEVYNTLGQKILTSRTVDGHNNIGILQKGIFIIRIGDNYATKVIMK